MNIYANCFGEISCVEIDIQIFKLIVLLCCVFNSYHIIPAIQICIFFVLNNIPIYIHTVCRYVPMYAHMYIPDIILIRPRIVGIGKHVCTPYIQLCTQYRVTKRHHLHGGGGIAPALIRQCN